MKRTLIFALSCLMTCGVALAQTQEGGTADKPKTQHKGSAKSVFPNQIQELKDAVAAQQEQIKQLQQQIQTRDQAIEALQQQMNTTTKQLQGQISADATKEGGEISDNAGSIGGLQADVKDIKATDANLAETLTETQKRVGELETPAAIHYKGVLITPGGFLAGETVWRQRSTIGDINTQFNGIPFSAAGQARQTEFYGSGRQSRLSLLIQGKLKNMNLTGYYEGDFLAAGVTSNNNQSNSYVFRQRQAWGQAALSNGWTFTAGQQWSLVAETRKGLDNRTEALPLQIDAQYVVGLSWARQYGFRVTKNFHNKFWFGVSLENAQTLYSASGAQANFVMGGPGNCGGLYNCTTTFGSYTNLVNGITTTTTKIGNTTVVTGVTPTTTAVVTPSTVTYSSNLVPDFIVKAAYEPGFGHYEVFIVTRVFRDRIYPNFGNPATVPGLTTAQAQALGAFNDSTTGFGGGANARWLFAKKKLETAVHFMAGNGVGRYGTSSLPDVSVQGSGYLHPLTAYQGLLSLEYHLPKWDIYSYGGVEYDGQYNDYGYINPFTKAKTPAVGYGAYTNNNSGCWAETIPVAGNGFAPGPLANCAGQTKDLVEGTLGFWYKPYNGPKGRLQMGLQYSYVTRQIWAGTNNYTSKPLSPTAINNMFFTSFRYYLP